MCLLSSSHRTLEGVRCLLFSQTEVSKKQLQTRTVFSSRIDHELPQAVPAVNRLDWDSAVLLKIV